MIESFYRFSEGLSLCKAYVQDALAMFLWNLTSARDEFSIPLLGYISMVLEPFYPISASEQLLELTAALRKL